MLVAFGCTVLITLQSFIIIAGVIKLIPLTRHNNALCELWRQLDDSLHDAGSAYSRAYPYKTERCFRTPCTKPVKRTLKEDII
mgnify:CR=1 FL=1